MRNPYLARIQKINFLTHSNIHATKKQGQLQLVRPHPSASEVVVVVVKVLLT